MSSIDSVEVPVGTLRYLLVLAEVAMSEANDANTRMARVSINDPSIVDELVGARAAILRASDHAARLHGALSAYIPEDES